MEIERGAKVRVRAGTAIRAGPGLVGSAATRAPLTWKQKARKTGASGGGRRGGGIDGGRGEEKSIDIRHKSDSETFKTPLRLVYRLYFQSNGYVHSVELFMSLAALKSLHYASTPFD